MEDFRNKRDLRGRGIEKIIKTMFVSNAKLIESLGQGKLETILTKPKNPPMWGLFDYVRNEE